MPITRVPVRRNPDIGTKRPAPVRKTTKATPAPTSKAVPGAKNTTGPLKGVPAKLTTAQAQKIMSTLIRSRDRRGELAVRVLAKAAGGGFKVSGYGVSMMGAAVASASVARRMLQDFAKRGLVFRGPSPKGNFAATKPGQASRAAVAAQRRMAGSRVGAAAAPVLDPTTGLYIDPATNLYINPATNQPDPTLGTPPSTSGAGQAGSNDPAAAGLPPDGEIINSDAGGDESFFNWFMDTGMRHKIVGISVDSDSFDRLPQGGSATNLVQIGQTPTPAGAPVLAFDSDGLWSMINSGQQQMTMVNGTFFSCPKREGEWVYFNGQRCRVTPTVIPDALFKQIPIGNDADTQFVLAVGQATNGAITAAGATDGSIPPNTAAGTPSGTGQPPTAGQPIDHSYTPGSSSEAFDAAWQLQSWNHQTGDQCWQGPDGRTVHFTVAVDGTTTDTHETGYPLPAGSSYPALPSPQLDANGNALPTGQTFWTSSAATMPGGISSAPGGAAINPATGMPYPINPVTGQPYDPATGQPIGYGAPAGYPYGGAMPGGVPPGYYGAPPMPGDPSQAYGAPAGYGMPPGYGAPPVQTGPVYFQIPPQGGTASPDSALPAVDPGQMPDDSVQAPPTHQQAMDAGWTGVGEPTQLQNVPGANGAPMWIQQMADPYGAGMIVTYEVNGGIVDAGGGQQAQVQQPDPSAQAQGHYSMMGRAKRGAPRKPAASAAPDPSAQQIALLLHKMLNEGDPKGPTVHQSLLSACAQGEVVAANILEAFNGGERPELLKPIPGGAKMLAAALSA